MGSSFSCSPREALEQQELLPAPEILHPAPSPSSATRSLRLAALGLSPPPRPLLGTPRLPGQLLAALLSSPLLRAARLLTARPILLLGSGSQVRLWTDLPGTLGSKSPTPPPPSLPQSPLLSCSETRLCSRHPDLSDTPALPGRVRDAINGH